MTTHRKGKRVPTLEDAEAIIREAEAEKAARPPMEDEQVDEMGLRPASSMRDEYQTKDNIAASKAQEIYHLLIFDLRADAGKRFDALLSFNRRLPILASEAILKLRDGIRFVQEPEKTNIVDILSMVSEDTEFPSLERCSIALCLYNHGYIEPPLSCYDGFSSIASDVTAEAQYRVESARYLFGSQQDSFIEEARRCLLSVTSDKSIASSSRYEIIAKFMGKSGIRTFLNNDKILVPYDSEFVLSLQRPFFDNDDNGVRERILSARFLLEAFLKSDPPNPQEDRTRIIDTLFAFADNTSLDENSRADALDVVLCRGTQTQAELARSALKSLGGGSDDIYASSQNAHDEKIAESALAFVEKAFSDASATKKVLRVAYKKTKVMINDLIRLSSLSSDLKLLAYRSLNRIDIDAATFTPRNLTLSDIIALVWMRVVARQKDDPFRETLEIRMLEELCEMGDTCSSGHINRLVNVLSSSEDETITISFSSQVIGNVKGRMNAKLMALSEDVRGSIACGVLPDSEDEDRHAYDCFVFETTREVHDEMIAEFVPDHMSEGEFLEAFAQGKLSWEKKLL